MYFIDFKPGCAARDLSISETTRPTLKKGQVLIKVAAFGINRADTLQREGQYPAPPGESLILGLEVAGEIVEMPSELSSNVEFKEGDQVFGLVAGGAYAEYVAVDVRHLIPQPDSMKSVEAASVAECYLTAYQVLFVEHRIDQHTNLLIHAGASGVGLAAIQLAKQIGCHIAVTASSKEKLAVCEKNGADLLINYKQSDFAEELKSHAKRDLIIDFVGGDYTNRNLSILNQDGVIIQLAILGGRKVENLDMAMVLGKRATLKGSTLRSRSDDYKANLVAAFTKDFWQSLRDGSLTPNIDTTYPAKDVGLAHERMQNNLNTGKLVCFW